MLTLKVTGSRLIENNRGMHALQQCMFSTNGTILQSPVLIALDGLIALCRIMATFS